MVQVLRNNQRPSFLESLGGGLAQTAPAALDAYFQERKQKKADEEQASALEKLGVPRGIKDTALIKSLLETNAKSSRVQDELSANKQKIDAIEKQYNLEPGALAAFQDDPGLAARIAKPEKKSISQKSIDPEQMKIIQGVRNEPGFDDLDEVGQYRALTDAGVSSANAATEAKLKTSQLERNEKALDKAYGDQKEFIDEITSKNAAFKSEMEPRLKQMLHIPPEDLIGPTAATFLEKVGIPLGALEDPSSELYQKLSQDLLKGLPETYGSRILKVEVDNFLKTIPTLLNSPDGRRMIASNMLKLGEMKDVYYNEMRKQQKQLLDSNTKFPKDFQQRVFDAVSPQIEKLNQEFVALADVKHVPEGTVPFFDPNGIVTFIPNNPEDIQWATENGGKKVW